jgi:hypothetical protein
VKTHVCRSKDASLLESFRAISDRIHDLWFWIDALEVDLEGAALQLPLTLDNSGPVELVLRCEGVDHVVVKDTEHIGQYDINYLSLAREQRELSFVCNIPIGITVRLRSTWELSLAEPQQAAGHEPIVRN